MNKNRDRFETKPFPRVRQPIVDALHRAKNCCTVHALIEVDVSDARNWVRNFRKITGRSLSFTSFVIFCLARSIDEDKLMHAYRKGSNLIIFDEVDIAVDIERDITDQGKAPIYPHVIKAANQKTLNEIHDEISAAKDEDSDSITKWTNRYWYLPGFIRRIIWRVLLGSPYWRKKLTGTVGISAVGMFGKGTGWGIPISTYTLSVIVGGIAEKPAIVKGQIAIRQYLSITASFDHDLIDGAPAARFIQRFRELIETGYGLHHQ